MNSSETLDAIVTENTLAPIATDASRLVVAFAGSAEDLATLSQLAALAEPPERFLLGRHAAYLWCPDGILQSRAAQALLGKPARAVTSRNWATVTKIHALLRDMSAP